MLSLLFGAGLYVSRPSTTSVSGFLLQATTTLEYYTQQRYNTLSLMHHGTGYYDTHGKIETLSTHHTCCLCKAHSHPSTSHALKVDVKIVWVTSVSVNRYKYIAIGRGWHAVGWVMKRQTIVLGISGL